MEHTLLMGDYGTGEFFSFLALQLESFQTFFKTSLYASKIIFMIPKHYNLCILCPTGKTLILEAAAKTLSERDDTKVVFIMALGETKKCFTLPFEYLSHT